MIAISYRRDDSKPVVFSMSEALGRELGKDKIFMDLDSIPPGADFRRHIRDVWQQCDVILIVIGHHWFGFRPDGKRRIDNPADNVRIEVEKALESGATVIPILVDRAQMPAEDDLPPSMKDLAYLNALELGIGKYFSTDMAAIIRELRKVPSRTKGAQAERGNAKPDAAASPPASRSAPTAPSGGASQSAASAPGPTSGAPSLITFDFPTNHSPEDSLFACAICGAQLSAPAELRGAKGWCPRCRQRITMPERPPPPATSKRSTLPGVVDLLKQRGVLSAPPPGNAPAPAKTSGAIIGGVPKPEAQKHYDAGKALYNKKSYTAAVDEYTKAITLDPQKVDYYYDRGWAYYMQLQRKKEALADFSKVVELDPKASLHHWCRGNAHHALGHFAQAVADYTKAIEIDPNTSLDCYASRGNAYEKLGKYREAIEDHTKSIAKDPKAQKYLVRGQIHSKAGNHNEAIADISKAIELEPKLAGYHAARAEAHKGSGNLSSAVEDYAKAIALEPRNSGYYNQRGAVLAFSLGKYQEALPDFTKAIELDPKQSAYPHHRARAYFSLGEFDKALADHNKAVELGGNAAIYFYFRGETHRSLGHKAEAIADYDRALKVDPGYKLALDARSKLVAEGGVQNKANGKSEEAESTPEGILVPGRSGILRSPFGDAHQLVDATGVAPGTLVKCPYSGKTFRVPLGFDSSASSSKREATPSHRASSPSPRTGSIQELRELGLQRMSKGHWEAAAMVFEDLLERGEPVIEYGPKLVSCLFSAHATLLEADAKRIAEVLTLVEQAGFGELAAPYRLQLAAKLKPPKKRWF